MLPGGKERLVVTLGVPQKQVGLRATTSVIQRAGVLVDKSTGCGMIYDVAPIGESAKLYL